MGLKSIIKGVPSVFKGIGNTLDILGKTKEMKDNGRELVLIKILMQLLTMLGKEQKKEFLYSVL